MGKGVDGAGDEADSSAAEDDTKKRWKMSKHLNKAGPTCVHFSRVWSKSCKEICRRCEWGSYMYKEYIPNPLLALDSFQPKSVHCSGEFVPI